MQIKGYQPKLEIISNDQFKLSFYIDEEKVKSLNPYFDYIFSHNGAFWLEINRYYPKRSINANAMFWSLCQALADAVGVGNDEMYHHLLKEYGPINIITLSLEDEAEWLSGYGDCYRVIEKLGPITEDGIKKVQYRCIAGSSTYDSKEMSRLIKGTVEECRGLGIPTEPDSVIKETLEQWNQ